VNITDFASDFREAAPAAAFEDMYKDNIEASVRGGLASGVPGDVRGLEYLHKKYGVSEVCTLTENSCLPSIEIAMESSMQSCRPCRTIRLSRYVPLEAFLQLLTVSSNQRPCVLHGHGDV